MKRFDDLTDAEVLALTDEDVERYIDLACAEAGVQLLPEKPGPAPEKPDETRDATLFEVAGQSFSTMEDAESVMKMINGLTRLDTNYLAGNYKDQYVSGSQSDVSITTNSVYSALRWHGIKEEMEAYAKAKKGHDSVVSSYKDCVRERNNESNSVRERVEEVHANAHEAGRLRRHLERYIELADGDVEVARRFLLNAYPDAKEYLPEEFPEDCEEFTVEEPVAVTKEDGE